MTEDWQSYSEWLQRPEQKALWELRPKDKQWAYDYCGPTRGPSGRNAIPSGHGPLYVLDWQGMTGLPPEFMFLHESVLLESQTTPDIDLPYQGCDYDWTEDSHWKLDPLTRLNEYLESSRPA